MRLANYSASQQPKLCYADTGMNHVSSRSEPSWPFNNAFTRPDGSSGSDTGSPFALLLQQVACEHDREIAHLQDEITRLTCKDVGVEVVVPSANFELDECTAEERLPCGSGPARVSGKPLEPTSNHLSNEIFAALGAELTTVKRGSQKDEQASIRNSKRSISSSDSWESYMSSADVDSSSDCKAVTFEDPRYSGTTVIDRSPLGCWQTLISFVKERDNAFVKLNSQWHLELETANAIDRSVDNKAAAYSVLMGAVASTMSDHPMVATPSEGVDSMGLRMSRESSFSEAADGLLKRWKRLCVLHPASRARICWDVIGMMMLMHDLTLIPLQVFDTGTNGFGENYQHFENIMDLFAVCFWTSDMLVSFMTGYYSAEGFVEVHHCQIAKNYMRSWFGLDAMIVAVDWICLALNLESEVGYLRLGKTFSRFMRIVRLLRLMKMNEQFSKLLEQIDSEYKLTIVGVSKLLFGMIFANHYIACGWYALTVANLDTSWYKSYLGGQGDLSYAYLTSMHWSLTQFTPASMDIHPTNSWERLYAIVTIIAAMVTFSSFVSSITGAMTHIRALNAKKSAEDAVVRQYFSMNKISFELACQVWHYRRRNMMTIKPRIKESDFPGFDFLPLRMREQLRIEVFGPILRQHPLFAVHVNICPESMSQICHDACRERRVLAGEELTEFKKEVSNMIFVTDGVLEYHNEAFWRRTAFGQNNPSEKASFRLSEHKRRNLPVLRNTFTQDLTVRYEHFQVRKGEWACEIALWSRMGKTSGPFVGGYSGCETVLLDVQEFQAIVQEHSEGAELFARYGELFVQRFNSAYNQRDANILFNCPEEARHRVRIAMVTCVEELQGDEASGDGHRKRLSERFREALQSMPGDQRNNRRSSFSPFKRKNSFDDFMSTLSNPTR